MVFIETDLGSGSGVIFDDAGHIATNYHVIEDGSQIDVVLPDGTKVDGVSVVGFDRRADLAVLDLPKSRTDGLQPIDLAANGSVTVGDPVFAIGYPFEGGRDQPIVQLSAGIISAVRPDLMGDVEFFQTDASFNAGLSGGVLVDADGAFIGMPTWVFGDSIGLATTVDDVMRLVKETLDAKSVDTPVEEPEGERAVGTIRDLYDAAGYRVSLEDGDIFRASIDAEADVALSLVGAWGAEVDFSDDLDSGGTETIEYEVQDSGPYTLTVVPYEYRTRFSLESSHALSPFRDPEDGEEISLGDTFIGELQFAGDEDTLLLDLDEGDRVELTLRSWDFDASLVVVPPRSEQRDDDDSGGGLSGTDAQLELTAHESGIHEVAVSFFSGNVELYTPGRGFYRLDVVRSP